MIQRQMASLYNGAELLIAKILIILSYNDAELITKIIIVFYNIV